MASILTITGKDTTSPDILDNMIKRLYTITTEQDGEWVKELADLSDDDITELLLTVVFNEKIPKTGLKVSNQLVADATRFLIAHLKIHV